MTATQGSRPNQSPLRQQEVEAAARARARTVKALKTVGALVLPVLGLITLSVGGLSLMGSGSALSDAEAALEYQTEQRQEAEAGLAAARHELYSQGHGVTPEDIIEAAEAGESLMPGGQHITVTRSPDGTYIVTGLGAGDEPLAQTYTMQDGEAVPAAPQENREQEQEDDSDQGEEPVAEEEGNHEHHSDEQDQGQDQGQEQDREQDQD